MENITPQKYAQYIKALQWNSTEMDIRYLILKYKAALSDYYHEEMDDADDLELIIDAFLYFSSLVPSDDLDEYAKMLIDLLDNKKPAKDYTDAEELAVYTYMISSRMISVQSSSMVLEKRCPVLYKMAAIIIPIKNYEEQYGDVNSYMEEMKESLKQYEEDYRILEKRIKNIKQ